jgi:hypothetical protein
MLSVVEGFVFLFCPPERSEGSICFFVFGSPPPMALSFLLIEKKQKIKAVYHLSD